MPTLSHSPNSTEAVKLLQRLTHLRSHFKLVMPENIATLRKQIHTMNISGVSAGFVPAPLFFMAGSVLARSEGSITMGELSRDLEVPLSTATRTMDWLVNNDYAQRLPDPKDRRIVRVELTQKGKETYQAMNTFILERVEQALSQLTPAERDIFIELLNKVVTAFEEAA